MSPSRFNPRFCWFSPSKTPNKSKSSVKISEKNQLFWISILISLPKSPLCPPQNFLRSPSSSHLRPEIRPSSEGPYSNFSPEIYYENPRPPPFRQQKKRPMAVINCHGSLIFMASQKGCRGQIERDIRAVLRGTTTQAEKLTSAPPYRQPLQSSSSAPRPHPCQWPPSGSWAYPRQRPWPQPDPGQ